MAIICSTVIFSASISSCSPVTMATTLKVWRFASFESSRNPIRGVCWNSSLIEVVGCCAQLNAPQSVMDGQSILFLTIQKKKYQISETKQVVIRQYMRIEVSIEFSACMKMMKKTQLRIISFVQVASDNTTFPRLRRASHDFTWLYCFAIYLLVYTTYFLSNCHLKRANLHLITSLRNESSEKGQILIQMKYDMPWFHFRHSMICAEVATSVVALLILENGLL